MRTGHTSRLWMVGGVLAAVAMLALGWFFAISTQRAETGRLVDETGTALAQVATLEQRLAELRAQNVDLDRYKGDLERNRRALPSASGLSDFLRDMQSAGERTGVSVSALVVGNPIPVVGAGSNVVSLPISLTVGGTGPKLTRFLDELQLVQPRAVLISTVNLAPAESGPLSGSVTLSVSFQAFVVTKGEPPAAASPGAGDEADPATPTE
jgi:Tfp pilus assembly protein PilO